MNELERGFREAAERWREAGVGEPVEVVYATLPSPVGELFAAATPRGLVRLAWSDAGRVGEILSELATKVSPKLVESPPDLADAGAQLEEYFAGERERFELPLDYTLALGFQRRVLRAVARIPYGETATYREIATRTGDPAAVRATGNAVAKNPIPIVIPCHRVVRSDGTLGGYGGGPGLKRFLLELEGALAD